MEIKAKDPDSVLDYQVNWAAWLPGDDTITASQWIITSPADTGNPDFLHIDSNTHTTTTTTVWVSKGGAVVGVTYELTNRIVTTAGRTQDQTIVLIIQEM